ncbi:MAG: LarC family nickel insertion protein, partial [Planctomycetes bacterium]|nr:LarC family nickel insertion protein [Planctomycetota bacterium]
MTSLLIDMPSGVAGDMLLAALIGCGGDVARMQTDLEALGLGPIAINAKRVLTGGLSAWLVDVDAPQEAQWQPVGQTPRRNGPVISLNAGSSPSQNPEPRTENLHAHRPYRAIRDLIAAAPLVARVRDRAQRVFRLLAESEAEVHGVDPETVEFHEVGAVDAIADVVGCCLLLEQLDVDDIVASPIIPGHGTVMCAHGRMPVPVPAVATMLTRTGAPFIALGRETGELTTPTGCALVCALATRFIATGTGAMIAGSPTRFLATGYGSGHKQIPGLVNVVRCAVMAGASAEAAASADANVDQVVEIRCQIDDATGEHLAALIDEVMAAGALDAFLTPVIMKKGRPGHLL